jgi:hypothetical protein
MHMHRAYTNGRQFYADEAYVLWYVSMNGYLCQNTRSQLVDLC